MAAFSFGGGMKIIVTGISGFIGGYAAKRLLAKGHTVAGFARQTNRLGNKVFQELLGTVQMYYGSLTDQHAVRWMVKDFQPDAVLHLGAISPVAYSFDHPHEVSETNYIGTVNLAEACLREVPQLKKFIFASSMETYGFQPKREAFVETDEQLPAAPYAVAKVAAEKYVRYLHYAHKFPGVAIRQTNAYGRKENDYFVVEAIATQMLKGNVANLGEPTPIRNFIFIDDLLDMYEAILASDDSVHGEVFNCGPDNGLSIYELAEKIRKKLGWHGHINWHTRPVRPGEIFYLNSSAEKAKQMLGWEPKVSLDEGLDRTIAIWRKNLGIERVQGTAYGDQLDYIGCAR
jgi:nucleoside-diphosphate-sugar epimerase